VNVYKQFSPRPIISLCYILVICTQKIGSPQSGYYYEQFYNINNSAKKEVYETGSQIGLLMIKATGPKFHNTVPLTYPLTLLTCEHQHIFIFSFYFVQHTITYVLEAFHLSLSYDSFPIF
jgi:hypothetical protein